MAPPLPVACRISKLKGTIGYSGPQTRTLFVTFRAAWRYIVAKRSSFPDLIFSILFLCKLIYKGHHLVRGHLAIHLVVDGYHGSQGTGTQAGYGF